MKINKKIIIPGIFILLLINLTLLYGLDSTTTLVSGAQIDTSGFYNFDGTNNIVLYQEIYNPTTKKIESKTVASFDNIAKGSKIKFGDPNDPTKITSAILNVKPSSQKTQLNINGVLFNVAGGTQIKIYEVGLGKIVKEIIPSEGTDIEVKENDLTYKIESNENDFSAKFYTDSNENTEIVSKKNFILTEDYKETQIEKISDGEMGITLDYEGDISKIKNAKINYNDGVSIESTEETKIFKDKNCIEGSNFICVSDKEIKVEGSIKITIKQKDLPYYMSSGEGVFTLESKGSTINADLQREDNKVYLNVIGKGVIENGDIAMSIDGGRVGISYKKNNNNRIPMNINTPLTEYTIYMTSTLTSREKGSIEKLMEESKNAIVSIKKWWDVGAEANPTQTTPPEDAQKESPIEKQPDESSGTSFNPCSYLTTSKRCKEYLDEATNYNKRE